MTQKKAIIFDLEGVVIDTELVWDEINIEFLKRRKITADAHEIKLQTMGKAMEEGIVIMMNMYKFDGDLKSMVSERRKIAEDLLRREVDFIPGFLAFFNKVKNIYSVGVATSMERLFLHDVDRRLKLNKLFDGHVYSIEDIGFISKPNPEIFLYTATKLGVNPRACIVIEDSISGVTAAKRANMYCIGLATTLSREKLAHANEVVSKYSEIKI